MLLLFVLPWLIIKDCAVKVCVSLCVYEYTLLILKHLQYLVYYTGTPNPFCVKSLWIIAWGLMHVACNEFFMFESKLEQSKISIFLAGIKEWKWPYTVGWLTYVRCLSCNKDILLIFYTIIW
jgi:hypothetical protein